MSDWANASLSSGFLLYFLALRDGSFMCSWALRVCVCASVRDLLVCVCLKGYEMGLSEVNDQTNQVENGRQQD